MLSVDAGSGVLDGPVDGINRLRHVLVKNNGTLPFMADDDIVEIAAVIGNNTVRHSFLSLQKLVDSRRRLGYNRRNTRL